MKVFLVRKARGKNLISTRSGFRRDRRFLSGRSLPGEAYGKGGVDLYIPSSFQEGKGVQQPAGTKLPQQNLLVSTLPGKRALRPRRPARMRKIQADEFIFACIDDPGAQLFSPPGNRPANVSPADERP
jgi:hypothetical protein